MKNPLERHLPRWALPLKEPKDPDPPKAQGRFKKALGGTEGDNFLP